MHEVCRAHGTRLIVAAPLPVHQIQPLSPGIQFPLENPLQMVVSPPGLSQVIPAINRKLLVH